MAGAVSAPTSRAPATTQKPTTEPGNVRALTQRRRGTFALAGLLAALGAAAGLVPYLLIYLLAVALLDRQAGTLQASYLWLLAGSALVAVVVKAVASSLALHLSHIAAYDTLYDLRLAIAQHLGTLPLGYFGTRTTGEIKKLIHEDVEQLEEGLAHILPDLVAGLTVPVLTLLVLFVVDWRMALATVALLPIAVAMYIWVHRRSPAEAYNARMARMNGAVIQYINGMKVLKAFLRADSSFAQIKAVAEDLRAFYVGPYAASAPALAVILTVVRANLLLLVPLGVLLYLGGSLDIPTFVLFLILGLGFNRPIWSLFVNYGAAAWQVSSASARIDKLLGEPPLPEPSHPRAPQSNDLLFRNVGFAYRDGTPVLHDVSFVVPAGSVTALVGPSGAGKSTIARLVPRFYDVTAGEIVLGGVDLRQIAREELMAQVAFVFQDIVLFNDTVAANIRVGKHDATDDEVVAVAKAACCHDFITALPQGYDTPIGENGGRLSGGQRQRLAVARALLKDAPVVVLDEATAFLDPENEAQIQQALAALLSAGKTVIVIAHRLSTITGVDQILVVDGGRVAARGTHDELLDSSPLYQTLWQAHMAAREQETTPPPYTVQPHHWHKHKPGPWR
jgi:ABC-type multidrug transport system fused ATPase/permease subunit